MDTRLLKYFVAVYEEQSLTGASKRCYVAQPSISSAIAQLEGELDTVLFVRHKKGTTPTSAAQTLYPMAKRLVGDLHAMRRRFRQDASPPSPLTLGLMRSLDIHRTLEMLKGNEDWDGVELRLVDADEACDIRIISRDLLRKDERFVRLWKERYAIAMPIQHPLALKPRLRVKDLEGQRFIERCHCEYRTQLRGSTPKCETVAVVSSEEWAIALVSAGIGLAVIPEGSATAKPSITLKYLSDFKASREVGIAYSANTGISPAVRLLIDHCKASTSSFATTRGRM